MPDQAPSPSEAAQPVTAPLSPAAMFLTVVVRPGGEDAVRDMLSGLSGMKRTVGFRDPAGSLRCVTGIGSAAWDRLFGGPRPAELHPFPGYTGARHTAPATPGDLLFHLRADRADLVFELASLITQALEGSADVVDEVHGFRYFDLRDLLGFVDGTENPEGADAFAAALVGSEDPGFTGGSYVIVQKYLHDRTAWDALSTEEQELVIGRRKLSDVELSDEEKPDDSHVAVNTIVDPDGTQRQIFRANMPFGSVSPAGSRPGGGVGGGEFGTYFIGYAATPSVTERMLERMFIGEPPGTYDRILDFSTAVTGGLFFCPPAAFLDAPPAPGAAAAATAVPAPPAAADDDGSLRIGSLKQ